MNFAFVASGKNLMDLICIFSIHPFWRENLYMKNNNKIILVRLFHMKPSGKTIYFLLISYLACLYFS